MSLEGLYTTPGVFNSVVSRVASSTFSSSNPHARLLITNLIAIQTPLKFSFFPSLIAHLASFSLNYIPWPSSIGICYIHLSFHIQASMQLSEEDSIFSHSNSDCESLPNRQILCADIRVPSFNMKKAQSAQNFTNLKESVQKLSNLEEMDQNLLDKLLNIW